MPLQIRGSDRDQLSETAFLGAVGFPEARSAPRRRRSGIHIRSNVAAVLFDPTNFPGLKVGAGATLTCEWFSVVNSPGAGYDQYGNWLSWGASYPQYGLQLIPTQWSRPPTSN